MTVIDRFHRTFYVTKPPKLCSMHNLFQVKNRHFSNQACTYHGCMLGLLNLLCENRMCVCVCSVLCVSQSGHFGCVDVYLSEKLCSADG